MVLIYTVFLVPIFLFSFFDFFKIKYKTEKTIFFFEIMYIMFFSSIIIESSGDYIHYFDSFKNINNWEEYTEGSSLKGYSFEPGFVVVNILLKNYFTTDPEIAMIILTLISSILLVWQFPKLTNHIFIALFVFITHFYYWLGLVLLRQIFAMAILLPVIIYLKKKQYLVCCILVFCACMFHASALIWLLFVFFYKIDLFQKNRNILIFSILSLSFGILDVFSLILYSMSYYIPRGDVLINYVMSSEQRLMNPLGYIEMLVILYLAIRFKDRLLFDNKYVDIAISLLSFSVILAGLFIRYEIGTRFVMYFNLFSYIIVLSSLVAVSKKNIGNKFFTYLFMSIYLIVFYIRFIHVTIGHKIFGVADVGELNM